MFGRALSWGSAFAVCIVHCSLVYQFEHSGKVRRAWFKFGFENFYSSLLSGSASFLCAALMSPQRTKQYCPQIEYIYIYIIYTVVVVVVLLLLLLLLSRTSFVNCFNYELITIYLRLTYCIYNCLLTVLSRSACVLRRTANPFCYVFP